MKRFPLLFCLAFSLFFLALATTVPAARQALTRPVPDEGGATPVYVTMALLDIDEINSADQNFTANLFMRIRWQDPRLAHDGPGKVVVPMQEIWSPQLQFVNQQKIWPTLPEVAHIQEDGTILYYQRIWGPFSQPLEVHDFPFDSQDFEIRLASVGYQTDEIQFNQDPEKSSGLAAQFSLPDWKVTDWRVVFDPYQPSEVIRDTASFALVLQARRHVSPYLYKVILPLILIVAMSWIVFWIHPKESGTQIGVATTSMLTLIAYRFMVGGEIPAVPYLTRLDSFILTSTLLVFAALMQAVITSIMANRNHLKGALWTDRVCRILFPTAFAALTYYALYAPRLLSLVHLK